MDKYIAKTIPSLRDEKGNNVVWWIAEHVPKFIEILEKNNPGYEFVQFVTSPGNGYHSDYYIMKLIEKFNEDDIAWFDEQNEDWYCNALKKIKKKREEK